MSRWERLKFYYRISGSLRHFFSISKDRRRFRRSKEKPGDTTEQFRTVNLRHGHNDHLLNYRLFAGDLDVLDEIFYRRIYHVEMNGKKDALIIDAGAHIGLASLYFLKEYNPATLICIEPDSENFSLLQKNVRGFISNASIQYFKAALGAEKKDVYFNKAKLGYNHAVSPSAGDLSVQSVCVNDFVQQFNIKKIDLIKIDIEDAEQWLFAKNTEWLAITERILIEIHSQKSMEVFKQAVRQYGFTLEPQSQSAGIWMATKT